MIEKMHFTGNWRDYQARVLEEMERHLGDGRLHVVAAPGAGKTVLGLEIVRRLGRPALVFAPSLAIRDQWRERLVPLFLPDLPGDDEVSRDLAELRVLTLATYQSLDSYRRSDALDALLSRLSALGPVTLVLDEAHHLRRSWWECLSRLAHELPDVTLVALTATPPYDASLAEWNRYESLCGPIDLEIGIPELVRNGDLCPHQDHLILSEPTADALALLENRRYAISALRADLCADEGFLDWLEEHPWLTEPETHVEAILAAPEMLSATLVMLGAAGRPLPRPPLKLLGVAASDLPPQSLFWLERLLDGLLFQQKDQFSPDPAWRKQLEKRLHQHALIEGKHVCLRHTRSVFRLLAASLAKLDSIAEIARAEQASLGDDLRMVVLSDHIRAGELPRSADADFRPAKLGVIPIFETLRRAGIACDHLAVLTGSLVIVPRRALADLQHTAAALGLAAKQFSVQHLAACPGHAVLKGTDGGSASLVRLVTVLFQRGDIRILVGTQSLLGQGWDAPALNTLVLASNTASFMMSNQMRGRAIRTDPARPGKVANIWHLATIEPDEDSLIEAATASFNWGHLNDQSETGLTDIGVVARRFRAFEGIANGPSNRIEDGLARLFCYPHAGLDFSNRQTFDRAANRAGITRKWARSLGEGSARSQVRETAAPSYAPRALSWSDTLHSLLWTAGGSAGLAIANELRAVTSHETIGFLGMGLLGIATLASLPPLARAALLTWRNGSLEGSLLEVAETVRESLVNADVVSAYDLADAEFEIRTNVDGRKDIVLLGASRAAERHIMQAIAEVLGPVQNPRYLLVRTSWFAIRRREDFHAVPAVVAGRNESAEHFARLWRKKVGSSELVFTRTSEGRRVLLKARMRSFAAGFQRRVDRRSAWL